ncbi:MAG TPA: sigma-70 family RNA polymerase sigma factor [bacterium]|nr:sigma-70 family RNA polymerase sigma factor [bacterium]
MPLLNPTDEPGDESLLAASLIGDGEAFSGLVLRYERRIYGLLWRLGVQPDAMDDVYQQVWLRAFNGRASFKGKSRFSTWLYAIALNETRAWRRRHQTQPLDSIAEPAAPGLSALDRLLGKARQEGLNQAMAALAPADRESLALRYQQGLDYEEISRLTGRSLAQTRLRNFRALARLRDLMKGHEL